MDATHEALRRRDDDPALGRHFDKNGDLDSDPLSQVRAGWMTARAAGLRRDDDAARLPAGRDASSQQLAKTADALTQAIVQAGWATMR